MTTVAYQFKTSPQFPHVEWLELYGDGTLHECAVLKTDAVGNKLFFKTNNLDAIDKDRLVRILSDRNARSMELWDLMSTKTLGNGVNALIYFNQLVKQLTAGGKVVDPRSGQIVTGTVSVAPAAV